MAWIYCRSRETVEGGVGPVAGVRAAWARGMPWAGWAGRPTPVLPCAQDCAHEQAATELTWTYLQRPPQPDPPRLPTGNQLLLLLLLLLQLVAGAGRSPAEHPLSCCAAECIRLNLHALLESI